MKAQVRDFEAFDSAHEGRRSNGDAHALARGSLYSSLDRHVWLCVNITVNAIKGGV